MKNSVRSGMLLLAALAFTPLLTASAIAGESQTKAHDNHAKKMVGIAKIGDLLIESAWTRQAPPAAKVVGGYAKITNNGSTSDRLLGGKASFAKRVEVHEMSVTDGVMKMKALGAGLEIKPGETVELKPGSFHLMFMGAVSPKAGETVPVTLVFEKAGDVEVMMPVGAIGSGKMPAMDHSKMKHTN